MEASSLPQSRVGGPGDVITIHILCQSLPPPKRFTLQNVSLSATVAQIKERIEQTFPGNPRASTQRLIYRGKPLRAEDAILGNILSRDVGFIPHISGCKHSNPTLLCRTLQAVTASTLSCHLSQPKQRSLPWPQNHRRLLSCQKHFLKLPRKHPALMSSPEHVHRQQHQAHRLCPAFPGLPVALTPPHTPPLTLS